MLRYVLFLLCLLFIHSVFGQVSATGLIKYSGHSGNIVHLQITVFGNKNAAVNNAPLQAIHALMFEGLPTATKAKLRAPFIGNETWAKQKHPDFFAEINQPAGYLHYLQEVSDPKRTKVKGLGERKAFIINISIDYESLLRDLRQQGIADQFGF